MPLVSGCKFLTGIDGKHFESPSKSKSASCKLKMHSAMQFCAMDQPSRFKRAKTSISLLDETLTVSHQVFLSTTSENVMITSLKESACPSPRVVPTLASTVRQKDTHFLLHNYAKLCIHAESFETVQGCAGLAPHEFSPPVMTEMSALYQKQSYRMSCTHSCIQSETFLLPHHEYGYFSRFSINAVDLFPVCEKRHIQQQPVVCGPFSDLFFF